jgi:hypothetical protein
MKTIRLLNGFALAFLCLGVLTGCKGPKVYISKTGTGGLLPPKSPDAVEVLKSKPDRPYYEVASMYAARFKIKNVFQIPKDLKKDAAVLGADAVLITSEGNDGSRAWASAAAIKYK